MPSIKISAAKNTTADAGGIWEVVCLLQEQLVELRLSMAEELRELREKVHRLEQARSGEAVVRENIEEEYKSRKKLINE